MTRKYSSRKHKLTITTLETLKNKQFGMNTIGRTMLSLMMSLDLDHKNSKDEQFFNQKVKRPPKGHSFSSNIVHNACESPDVN